MIQQRILWGWGGECIGEEEREENTRRRKRAMGGDRYKKEGYPLTTEHPS